MPSLQTAYNWLVNTCNAPNVGYDMNHREQETVDGVTYYDCSSILWYALNAGGWGFTGSPFTTDTMKRILFSSGWQEVDINGLWVAGDIVWRPAGFNDQGTIHEYGHCEMVFSGSTGYGITMGAHSARYELPDQVSINSNPSYAHSYQSLLRYTGGGGVAREWIRDPTHYAYFDDAQMQNNALCLRDWFVTHTDWTLQAIAGLAGNIQQESTFNPDSIESASYPIGTPGKDGIGLVQWTTASASEGNPLFQVLIYLYGSSSDWGNPEKQCGAIMAEYGKTIGTIPAVTTPNFDKGWYSTSQYQISWYDWAHSTGDPGELANAFDWNYERPSVHHPERAGYARTWYQYFLDNPYTPSPIPTAKKGLKIWEMIRYRL